MVRISPILVLSRSDAFRVGRVRELPELAGDEIRRALADVDGVVADPPRSENGKARRAYVPSYVSA
jgi:hypothetical protein